MLPFGRRIFFSFCLRTDILEFCSGHFSNQFRAEQKLRVALSCSIYVGVARTFNLALRRFTLSAAAISLYVLDSLSGLAAKLLDVSYD